MLAELAPLFRRGRYFDALMALNARLAELIRTHGPSAPPRREAGRSESEAFSLISRER